MTKTPPLPCDVTAFVAKKVPLLADFQGEQTKYNPRNKPLIQPFVSLYLRGGTDGFGKKTLKSNTLRQVHMLS